MRRGENYLKTRDQKKALDFCLLAAIKNLRKSRHPFHLFSDSARNLIVQFGFSDFISEIEECYRFLTTGNRLDAFALIEGWGIAYSEVILAEIEYLRSQFAINSRDVHERLEAIARLEGWRHYHDKEFEQWTRLMVLLRSALILDMDKRPARELDAEITRRMSERIHFDPDAEKVMHALGRSAEGLALPEIAIRRVARSEKFFRPKATRVSLDPPEHFRCLNNMAALNIAVGNYDNAEMFADEAIDLAGRFSNFVFPRRDFCHSLKVLAQFRKEMLSASEAAELQQSIISDFGVGSDPYYTRNYQAVYHCLAGDSEKAIALWSEMHESLLCHEEVEQNPYYFIASNLCAARYIREGDADIAIAQWDKLALSVEKIPYETRAILMQRHQVLRNVFERKISISSIEWDMYPIKMIARPLSSCWQELGRGFRMPDVQFWSMY
nr:hypothetical protein [uncultured Cohaesibacter sp.]